MVDGQSRSCSATTEAFTHRHDSGLVLDALQAKRAENAAVFTRKPDDLVGIDVAPFDDLALKLLEAELQPRSLPHHAAFGFGELAAAEFSLERLTQAAKPPGGKRAAICARERNPSAGMAGPSFDSSEQHRLRSERHDGAVGAELKRGDCRWVLHRPNAKSGCGRAHG